MEAQQVRVTDRTATADEESAAEGGKEALEADPEEAARPFEEMSDIGARVKGEGQVD
jgi:hypothetical protein